MALKKLTKSLLTISKRHKPLDKTTRKMFANVLKTNRKAAGSSQARTSLRKDYSQYL